MQPIACLPGWSEVSVQVLLTSRALISATIALHHSRDLMACLKKEGSLCKVIEAAKEWGAKEKCWYDKTEEKGYCLPETPICKEEEVVVGPSRLQW